MRSIEAYSFRPGYKSPDGEPVSVKIRWFPKKQEQEFEHAGRTILRIHYRGENDRTYEELRKIAVDTVMAGEEWVEADASKE